MSPKAQSWHISYISKYNIPPPEECVNVVFLQQVVGKEYTQVLESLKDTDQDWINTLAVPNPPARSLNATKWIRDNWPSSDAILQIAEHANSCEGYNEKSYRSLIFVDSGWEAGNCIAARWEGEGDNFRLNAARVPMNIANSLLSACDSIEGHTLASILGVDIYEGTKVDFYADATGSVRQQDEKPKDNYTLPGSVPQDLALNKEAVVIVSLKQLSQEEIEGITRRIMKQPEIDETAPPIKLYNGDGSCKTRKEILKLFNRIYSNSEEENRGMPIFLVDYLYEPESGEPQLLLARKSPYSKSSTVQLLPARTEKVLKLWVDAKKGFLEGDIQRTMEYVDIWDSENVHDLSVQESYETTGCPVFYLQPFTSEQERILRSNLRELSDVEEEADWGADWTYEGYIFPDEGQTHTLEDFRDILESCDPFSPSYDPKKPGPYPFHDYPHHFVAVDDKIFDDEPQVWLVSSLDFWLDGSSDRLGWTYGLILAKDAHINWGNLDIANMGPEEMINEPERLWLSDLHEAKKEWQRMMDEHENAMRGLVERQEQREREEAQEAAEAEEEGEQESA